MSKRPMAPCYQCNERVFGCHSICPKYKDFKQEVIEMKTAVKQYLNPIGSRYFKEKSQIPECARYSKKRYR